MVVGNSKKKTFVNTRLISYFLAIIPNCQINIDDLDIINVIKKN